MGRITNFVDEMPEQGEENQEMYYLCGNGDMVLDVEERLMKKGVGKKQIHKERFN